MKSTARQAAHVGGRARELERSFAPGHYEIKLVADDELVTATSVASDTAFFFEIPDDLDGTSLVFARAFVSTPADGDLTVMVVNTSTYFMLLSPIQIDAGTSSSKFSAFPPEIDPTYARVSEGDQLYIQVTTPSTSAKGLGVMLRFQ